MYRYKSVLFILYFATFCSQMNAKPSDQVMNTAIKNDNSSNSNTFEPNAIKRQPIVRLPAYGLLQGSIGQTAWNRRKIYQFLNVAYAESPSGNRRFKAPVRVKSWNGTRNTGSFGTKCPTLEDLNKLTEAERENGDLEDCLSIAIYSPNLNGSVPVMFYVHGGGFASTNAQQFPPNYLLERDVVLAVPQFRLSALGFLSTNSKGIPGNAGLLDIIQALKFTKENIRHFGGDPNKITIFGQSSGAAMISALIISPNVPSNLFHRAIIQSGSILGNWAHSTDAMRHARSIAAAAGLNPNQSKSSLNREFLSLKVFDLLEATEKNTISTFVSGKYPTGGRSLTIGGPTNLLPDQPENIIKSKNYNKSIPMIIGTTKTDGSYLTTVAYDFLTLTNTLNEKNFMMKGLIEAFCRYLGIYDASGSIVNVMSQTFWTFEQLNSDDFGKCAPGIIDMLGMGAFKAPVLKFAKANANINPNETFLYTFDYKGEHTRFGYGGGTSHYPFSGGVAHSDDLIYLFPYPQDSSKFNEDDTKMAQTLVDLWTSFAIDGTPKLSTNNGVNPFQWKPLQDSLGAYLHIDKNLHMDNDFRKEFTVQSREQQKQSNNTIQ